MMFEFSFDGDKQNLYLSNRDRRMLFSSKFIPTLEKAMKDLDRVYVPIASYTILKSIIKLVINIPELIHEDDLTLRDLLRTLRSFDIIKKKTKQQLKSILQPYVNIIFATASTKKISKDSSFPIKVLEKKLGEMKLSNPKSNCYFTLVYGCMDNTLLGVLIKAGAHSWTKKEPFLFVEGTVENKVFRKNLETEWENLQKSIGYSIQEMWTVIKYCGAIPQPICVPEDS